MTRTNAFIPDWASPPGDTIADILHQQNISSVEFSEKINASTTFVNDLLAGRAEITEEIARRLENTVGSTARFWLTREAKYRENSIRVREDERDNTLNDWLKEIPYRDMIKFGWISPNSKDDLATECLDFFDVSSVGTWRSAYAGTLQSAAFRTSDTFQSQPGAVAAWLRRGELESEDIKCADWDRKKFEEALNDIRALTRLKDPHTFIPILQKKCADCGVAVVIVRAPTGCRASGATRFLSEKKALLLLSFRYLSDDHFWFSFFHEAGHLILHGKKALFLEGADMIKTAEEEEANNFAAEILIPASMKSALLQLRPRTNEVIRFAVRAGIAPGIVVGQLQHKGHFKQNQLNTLKRRYRWD